MSSSSQALTDLVKRGWIAPIWCDGREILRRIFVSARDSDWREVPVTHWHVTKGEISNTVQIEARHTSELVDFEWCGQLEVSCDSRQVRFRIEGRALRDMDICRLGLVILHPVESMVGAEVIAHGPHGEERLTVNRVIHPQPIVNGLPCGMTAPFSTLEIEGKDIDHLRLDFTGDLFELEDQRNWGDASFKTYCTPLSLGFPRHLTQGTVVAQAIEVIYTPPSPEHAPRKRRSRTRAGNHAWLKQQGRVPAIGCVLTEPILETLMSTTGLSDWDHVQLPWDAVTPNLLGRLMDVLPRSTQLELVVQVEQHSEHLYHGASVVQHYADRIARILVTDPQESLPSASAVADLRRVFAEAQLREVPVLLLPRGYFVELNRGQHLHFEVDGFAFPLSPTVHASDAASVIDNVEAATDMVATLRNLTKGAQIAIAPLAAYYPAQGAAHGVGDPLWTSWLTKSLARLSVAGATSITLAPDVVTARS